MQSPLLLILIKDVDRALFPLGSANSLSSSPFARMTFFHLLHTYIGKLYLPSGPSHSVSNAISGSKVLFHHGKLFF